MKRYNRTGILTTISLLLWLIICTSEPLSALNNVKETERDKEKIQQEVTSLEETIQMLSDEKQRSDVILYLETLLKAKKEGFISKKEPDFEPERHAINFVQLYQDLSQRIQSLWLELTGRLSRLTTGYHNMKFFLSKRENRYMILDLGLKGLISLLASGILWILLKILAKKWKITYQKCKSTSLFGKIKALLFTVLIESYHLAVIFLFAWLFLNLTFPDILASFIIYILGAWFLYKLSKGFCRLIIYPPDPHDRLFQVSDTLALYIITWCHRFLIFSLWIFMMSKFASFMRSDLLLSLLLSTYRIGLLIMAAAIMIQRRESLHKLLFWPLEEDDLIWQIRLKEIYNHVSEKIYLGLIFYFTGIVLSYILGYHRIYKFLLSSTLLSILAIMALIFIDFLWQMLFEKISEIGQDINQRYPALEKQVNQSINWLNKLVRFSLILLTVFILLSIWGRRIPGFLSSYLPNISKLIRLPFIILITAFLTQVINFLIQKMITHMVESRKDQEAISTSEMEKQMTTIGSVIHKSILIVIFLISGAMILHELGFSIGPLLTGAGVLGVAFGFGSQGLVKDIIGGLFMIIENQIRVGDVAILNGTGGFVEKINLRTTILRSLDGTVHVFPNGSINTVSNMTQNFSFYVFDIGVAYKEDVDRVCAVLKEISDRIIQEEKYKDMIIEPLEILGLDKFGDSGIIIKARIKTKPIKQWEVGREMNRRIKKRFDEEGIEIPFPHRTIYWGEASKPLDLSLRGFATGTSDVKDFIRKAIKEIINEEQDKL